MGTIPQNKISLVKKLYYDKGYGMQNIASYLNVSIYAVEYFMKHNSLKRRSYSEASKIVFNNTPLSFKIKTKLNEQEEKLKIKAVMIYWCEGSKSPKSHTVDLANCDPLMLKIFIRFLRKICRVDEKRIKIYLYAYSNQDISKNIEYWSHVINIPKSQFTQPYIRTDFQESKIDKMPHGMIHIRYADTRLLNIIKEWIKQYSKT